MPNTRLGIEVEGPGNEMFRVESKLGAGSFGEVYRAVGVDSGLVVAIKIVPEAKLADPATMALRTVVNEIRTAMLEVRHPNVVRILYVNDGTDPALGPYLVMEFVDGQNLRAFLDARKLSAKQLPLDEALDLMRQIALGAQEVNAHLVHRDIKPDNILLDRSVTPPRPRIADFGVAKFASAATRPTAETLKGMQPVWYMAPEAWRDEANDFRLDVYSVGLVFYEILTLEHPLLKHVSEPWNHVKWRTVHESVPCEDVRVSRVDVPLSIAKVLLRMVDKLRGNRPTWDDVVAAIEFPSQLPREGSLLDPDLVEVFKRQADESLREEQALKAKALRREREAERATSIRREIQASGRRLLERFDAIVADLNSTEVASRIETVDSKGTSRRFRFPNGHELSCHVSSSYETAETESPTVLGSGYMGVSGGLSANLMVSGSPDNAGSAVWTAIAVNVSAAIAGQAELKYLEKAGLDNATIRFMLGEGRDSPRRRHLSTHFGFPDSRLFQRELARGAHAVHVYSFSSGQDPLVLFQRIMADGLQMSTKR